MNLHEYQAKRLFRDHSIPVPPGMVAANVTEAIAAAHELAGPVWVVKAQVHAGGRGKAGGVRLCRSAEEVGQAAAAMLGQRLVTKQTDARGLPVNQVYVESGSAIERELYLSLLLNRDRSRIAFVASAAGGMEIEEVAANQPEKILHADIDPAAGLQSYQCRRIAFGLGLAGNQIAQFEGIARALYDLYRECDLGLVEINPLSVTKDGRLVALDAKINVEANSLYRQPALVHLRDPSQEDPMERAASEHDLSYVALDGNIACMVNGAGLAMATMDLIKLHGGAPANFLDVGGTATAERVTAAFRLILSNERVRAVLVNIFGGIVRCDVIAEGIVQAVQQAGVTVPVIVRLEGTNADRARKILKASGLAITPAKDLADAATKAVRLAGGRARR
ncbi:MAG: ADP-forming succinate--CoA ligase subunit beta [Gammaproteobacteria bacterium]|nr:ADP-forming succinate--CoA ligase subunit beta [Gammaproteobacteria bacterium]